MPKKTSKPTGSIYKFPTSGSVTILLTHACKVVCSHCGELKPLQLRQMPNGAIRNQPQCAACRGRY